MSRYFFHIRDGLIFVPDEEGMEMRTMRAVEEEARASAEDMALAALRSRLPAMPAAIEVKDEQGTEVFRIPPSTWVH